MAKFTGDCEDGIDEKGWEKEMAKPIPTKCRAATCRCESNVLGECDDCGGIHDLAKPEES